MASPPISTSRLRFCDLAGGAIAAPSEWTPALIEVEVDPTAWPTATLHWQETTLPLSVRRLGGRIAVVAEWPRAGPGHYRLRLDAEGIVDDRLVTIRPEKISQTAYGRLLEDLETRLPAVITVALQRLGAFTGITIMPPAQVTLAQELLRLRRAIDGTVSVPGMIRILPDLAADPHRVLELSEYWVRAERARRPHPARLPQAVARRGNLVPPGHLVRLLDTRVDETADVYENRLVKVFVEQLDRRFRRLLPILAASAPEATWRDAAEVHHRLVHARRQAAFLDGVSMPVHLPTRLTMVLLRRPAYRAAFEAYLAFHRSVSVRLEDPALDAPLENLPHLYQVWGTLSVIAMALEAAAALGYRIERHLLVQRDASGLFVRILPDGRAAIELHHPAHETLVRLVPERTYGAGGEFRSVSFQQRPDVAVEVVPRDGPARVYLFDPKYKLDGAGIEGDDGSGQPKKVDVDKMHAYRDAIRDHGGRRVVQLAAILYPGSDVRFGPGIEALPAVPGHDSLLVTRLRDILTEALAAS